MRIFHFVFVTILALSMQAAPGHAQGAFGVPGVHNVDPLLQAESDVPAPGRQVAIAFSMTPRKGWHGYWENPGDAGVGMQVKWNLPAGVTVGPVRYPVPQTLIIAGLMNYVYEGPYAPLVMVNVPATMKRGDRLPVRVHASWLACTAQLCVPDQADLSLDLVVGDGGVTPARGALFDGYRAALPRPLGSEGRFAVAGRAVRIAIPYPAGARLADPYFFPLTRDAVTYAAPQKLSRNGDMLIVETVASGAAPAMLQGVLRVGKDRGLVLSARPGAVPAAGVAIGQPGSAGAAGGVWRTALIALAGAIAGGLILNIMPCVFPILSLKALSLAMAGGHERSARRDAIAYTLGVVATCLALGGGLLALRAGGAQVGWAFQLQDPRVILLLLLLVMAIALNLAGLFELGSVSFGNRLAAQGGAAGSFWTGALAAFVATPCAGPFLGTALGAALVLPAVAALAVFAGLGLGLALPFLLLAFVPALRGWLPRPGPWMERLRRILSVPMFLTAAGLVWLLGRQTGTDGMAIGIGVVLVAALLLRWVGGRQRAGRGAGVLAPVIGLVALIAGGALLLPTGGPRGAQAARPTGNEIAFDERRLAALRAQKQPVFLYFTADWCLSCKVNEAAAISRPEVADAFRRAGVAVMVGDWTNADPAIGRFLEAQGRSGVPLYLYYAPGATEARVLPQVLTPGMLTGLMG